LNDGTTTLLRMVKARRFRHGGNPILRMMANNAVGKIDDNEKVKPDKKKSNGRIDGISAAVMAIDSALRDRDQSSAYEEHGLEVLEA
jgi:phage terminase large subunit-like protein